MARHRRLLVTFGVVVALVVAWCNWGGPSHQRRVRRARWWASSARENTVLWWENIESSSRAEARDRGQRNYKDKMRVSLRRETRLGTIFKFGPYAMFDEELDEAVESARKLLASGRNMSPLAWKMARDEWGGD